MTGEAELTHPDVLGRGVEEGWADPQTDPAMIEWEPRLAAAAIPFAITPEGRPLSPFPPAGVRRGRNGMGRWGENLTVVTLVTAYYAGVRHVLLAQRAGGWALPGGPADPGESGVEAGVRWLALRAGLAITGPGACQAWPARHHIDARASDEAWAVDQPVRIDLGDVEELSALSSLWVRRVAWVPARDWRHLETALRLDHRGGRVAPAHEAMLRRLLGPWHSHSRISVSCSRCGVTATDCEDGRDLYFTSVDEASRRLPDFRWRVTHSAGEVLCDACAAADDCARLGHEPATTNAMLMPDGSVTGPLTWCQRCDELLDRQPGSPAPKGYPAPDPATISLNWDAAALPGGQELALALARLMSLQSARSVAARWDAWDGPQDGRPRPPAPRNTAADRKALELIQAASRVLSPEPAGQAS